MKLLGRKWLFPESICGKRIPGWNADLLCLCPMLFYCWSENSFGAFKKYQPKSLKECLCSTTDFLHVAACDGEYHLMLNLMHGLQAGKSCISDAHTQKPHKTQTAAPSILSQEIQSPSNTRQS